MPFPQSTFASPGCPSLPTRQRPAALRIPLPQKPFRKGLESSPQKRRPRKRNPAAQPPFSLMPIGRSINRSLPLFSLLFAFDLRPRILERHSPVEDRRTGLAVRIDTEIPEALELHAGPGGEFRQSGFDLRGHDTHGVGVQQIRELHAFGRIAGRRDVNRCSYRRTSADTAWGTETQWMVPLILRPSGVAPPFDSGS